jgi:hypothetical protein
VEVDNRAAWVVLWLAVAALTGCAQPDQRVVNTERRVANSMKDPESAKFSKVSVGKGPDGHLYLCGFVNGKNGFGAYAGAQRFIAPLMSSADTDTGPGYTSDIEFGSPSPTIADGLSGNDITMSWLKKCDTTSDLAETAAIRIPSDQQ